MKKRPRSQVRLQEANGSSLYSPRPSFEVIRHFLTFFFSICFFGLLCRLCPTMVFFYVQEKCITFLSLYQSIPYEAYKGILHKDTF
jgi:hypothetical protein